MKPCVDLGDRVQFEVSGIKRLVSSAYFINLLSLDLGSTSITYARSTSANSEVP